MASELNISWNEVLQGNPLWFNHMLGYINKKRADENRSRK